MKESKQPARNLGHCMVLMSLVLAGLGGCRVTDLPLWGPGEMDPGAEAVIKKSNIAYYSGPDADPVCHRLDLFLPQGKKDFPVVILVHGGAWIMGDNRSCGLYSSVGTFLASQGIGAVLPNYRLSPAVKHPAHVQDVARALAWTRSHIADYGGDRDHIFLAGHSAGGHLVALLTTDEKYLKAEGLSSADVKGVIAISGVYSIPPGSMEVPLGGGASEAFRLDEIAPLRGASQEGRKSFGPSVRMNLDVFALAFSRDPQLRQEASPQSWVRPGLPPFLILHAENDLPTLAGMAAEFHQALNQQGCKASLHHIAKRNHNSIIFQAISSEDPVARAILAFIRERSKKEMMKDE